MEHIIETKDLKKCFGDNEILKGVNMFVDTRQVVSIIGSSGSGKSTLLRCLNLLEWPTSGEILFHGNSILTKQYNIPHYRKNLGMVFQQFNLFSNLSILDNCIVGPVKVNKKKREDAIALAHTCLKQVNMDAYVNAKPKQLSGGQQQRVAIARALCMEPEVLLFDEPTSALDPEMVGDVLNVISDLASSGLTMVVVTHEMAFARDVSDRVLYMHDGIIEVDDTPQAVFENPKNPYLYEFLARFLKQ